MKSQMNKIVISFCCIGIFIFCIKFQNAALGSTSNPDESNQKQQSGSNILTDINVVGKINEFTITRQELMKRLISEYQPDPYRLYSDQRLPNDANAMLLQILGEKAVVLEARKQGLLEDETIRQAIISDRQNRIVNLWVQDNIKKERSNIAATEEEIAKQIEANPNMNREQAKAAVETAKSNKILDQCYTYLYKKSEVKKLTENFSKAIQLHDKLLNHPVKSRPSNFIRDYQVREELTEEEKNIVLAEFTNGKITLEEWFDILCDFSPVGRPKNLNTEEGIDQLLENAIVKPLIAAEVHELGLDNNPAFLKQIRDYENELLLNYVRNQKSSDINEPAAKDILDFFNKNKDFFITGRMMKIDEIWFKDLQTAQIAKKELDSGKDFNDVKKEYSIFPNSQSYQTSLNNEGFFWKELWSNQQKEIIGPIKGFQGDGIKWRIVKIIEKQQGKSSEFSKELETNTKYLMMSEMAIRHMADYCMETLKKYPYEVYSDRIKDIDPMNIP